MTRGIDTLLRGARPGPAGTFSRPRLPPSASMTLLPAPRRRFAMSTVRDFGARGDGRTDDTAALSHAVQHCDGLLVFPRGDYLISRPLYVPLQLHGRLAVTGSGGTARLLMNGPGSA